MHSAPRLSSEESDNKAALAVWEQAFADYKRQRVMTDSNEKRDIMADVVSTKEVLERKLTLQIEFAELLASLDPVRDQVKIAQLPEALVVYQAIEQELKKHKLDQGPLAKKFYSSFDDYRSKSFLQLYISDRNNVDYLSVANEAAIGKLLEKYTEIYDYLCAATPAGWKAPSTLIVLDLKKDLELRLADLRESSLQSSPAASEQKSDEDDVNFTTTQRSQALNTGSTTGETGFFAFTAQAAERERLAAIAALAAQQSRPTGPTQQ